MSAIRFRAWTVTPLASGVVTATVSSGSRSKSVRASGAR